MWSANEQGPNFSYSTFCRHLDKAKREVAIGGLGILAKYRKKQHLIDLLESLRTIKTLVCKHDRDYITPFTPKLKKYILPTFKKKMYK